MRRGHAVCAVLACTLVWSDFFPAPEMSNFKGPDAFVEIKVEHCDHWRGRWVKVSRRYYRDIAGPKQIEQEEIMPWQTMTQMWQSDATIRFPREFKEPESYGSDEGGAQ